MRLRELFGRRRRHEEEALDPELERLFLRSSRVPIPEEREILRARSRVSTALAEDAPARVTLPRLLATAALVTGAWRPALGGAAVVAVLMLAVMFAALASSSERASAGFEEQVAELTAATDAALADGEIDEDERDEIEWRIAALVSEATPETLAELDIAALASVADSLGHVEETLAGSEEHVADAARGLSSLAASVAGALVSEASEVCGDAETREGLAECQTAFHATSEACGEFGNADTECREALELVKKDAEARYETLKRDAESATGCEEVAALDEELGTACEVVVEGVADACDGGDFSGCRQAFHEARAACEELGEIGFQGCKSGAEAVKDAADEGDGEAEGSSGAIDSDTVALIAAFNAARGCEELPVSPLAEGCQSTLGELTEACSDIDGDEQRDRCRGAFLDLLGVFHEGRQACGGLGEASDACIDALERLKDAAENDVKDAAERDYEELKGLAEDASSCGEVSALDAEAGAACSSVVAAVAEACAAEREACREAFHEAREACGGLGPLAAEGCSSEIEQLKDAAEERAGEDGGPPADLPAEGQRTGGTPADPPVDAHRGSGAPNGPPSED